MTKVYPGEVEVRIPLATGLLALLLVSLAVSLVATVLIGSRFYLVWRREWAMVRAGHLPNPAMSSWGLNVLLVESGIPFTLTGTLAAGITIAIFSGRSLVDVGAFRQGTIFAFRFDARAVWLITALVQGIWPSIMALGPQLIIFHILSGAERMKDPMAEP
ncbi:hypothetical protein BKA70DRAFT_190296 [Coprinopsis sp. MPI-PUGE-AT-0042]|nr:hypothetical protein BKA70DRAFT_190296 [Coprinopsis sp. MPI-PUGE-AT-0042]